jgi:hypothetical protein
MVLKVSSEADQKTIAELAAEVKRLVGLLSPSAVDDSAPAPTAAAAAAAAASSSMRSRRKAELEKDSDRDVALASSSQRKTAFSSVLNCAFYIFVTTILLLVCVGVFVS